MSVSFKVKVKCERYDCKASVETDCKLSVGEQGIPTFYLIPVEGWDMNLEDGRDYHGAKDTCLCPEHNTYYQKQLKEQAERRKKGQ